jgi:hypothetical protein
LRRRVPAGVLALTCAAAVGLAALSWAVVPAGLTPLLALCTLATAVDWVRSRPASSAPATRNPALAQTAPTSRPCEVVGGSAERVRVTGKGMVLPRRVLAGSNLDRRGCGWAVDQSSR